MDFEKIKELVKLIDSTQIAFFELQSENDYIKMDKSLNRGITSDNSNNISDLGNTDAALNSPSSVEKIESHINVEKKEAINSENKEVAIEDENLKVITSPMVGTFYASASPGSPAFIEIGDTVSKGKVICIIEAMKLMNEIESDYSGVIVERLVNDGDMVEYGQPLFKVKGE